MMKRPWYRLPLIALLISSVTFGLAFIAIWIDPWTGEGDGTIGTKFITVPLAMLGLPFLAGMSVADILTKTHQRVFSLHCGAIAVQRQMMCTAQNPGNYSVSAN